MLEHLTLRPQAAESPLQASYAAFMLSREAMRCTAKTLEHYHYTVGAFVAWLTERGATAPQDITPDHVRAYLVTLQRRNTKDTTQHAHARGIKTWLNWLVAEGDLEQSPMRKVPMPRLEKRIPSPFTPDELQTLLDACARKTHTGARDYAIVLTLLDTGLRASEFLSLRVGDLDMRNGLATVMGKGGKQRQVRAGAKARGAIVRGLANSAGITEVAQQELLNMATIAELSGPLTDRGRG